MITKEAAYKAISELVKRFDEQIGDKASLSEKQTRIELIDPFFNALGWDMSNSQGKTNAYKEVIHEYKLKIEGKTTAPDYSFRNEKGNSKFFVEAKKPSVNIKTEYDPAYQIRLYGWNNKLYISVLTDFEEFAIYNCQKKPKLSDKPNISRIEYFTYKDYLNKFDFIWNTFSRQAVLQDSLEIYASKSAEKATETVDKDFLNTLEVWRNEIATNIAIRNLSFSEEEINYTVQQTLNRIIFLRFCEARNIEPDGNLKSAVAKGDFYQNLYHLFLSADEKYNSGLFDFKKDRISKDLVIDNKVLKFIIDNLYPDKSIYKFDYIPVEILGYAYEQFLGSVIRLTAGHHVKVEPKPEVREANGVYYTPEYVVRFIVENTIGKLIKGKTPDQIAKIKILDPACGSGSFLIAAFDYLINYHQEYYTKQTFSTKKQAKTNPLDINGYLTANAKKQILLNNIFGVDLDSQAVEVTKLSLMLKAMENQTHASIQTQLSLWHERVLPNLDRNIKCGNSLIANDFYGNQFDFDSDFVKKVNAFDWKKEFKDIFDSNGFDCVIGNPPYVGIHQIQPFTNYFKLHYKVSKGQFNLFSLFIEKSLILVKDKHFFSFIIPSLFIKGVQHQPLREVINQNSSSFLLKEYGDKVFDNVQMPTCVFILKKGKPTKIINHFENKNDALFKKVKTICLGELVDITRGLEIGKDKLINKGKIEIISGTQLNKYVIKESKFISKETYIAFAKSKNIFEVPKILIRETGSTFIVTFDDSGIITTRSIYNIRTKESKLSLKSITAILNSKLFDFYFNQFIAPETNIFPKIRIAQISQIPIPLNIFTNTNITELDKSVDTILHLKKELLASNSQMQTAAQLQRRIDHLIDEIDNAVFSLYGINKEEQKLI